MCNIFSFISSFNILMTCVVLHPLPPKVYPRSKLWEMGQHLGGMEDPLIIDRNSGKDI